MENRKGDRDLSVLEFYKELQKEYFIAEIRSKIYPKLKDKKYFKERVMVGKKRVIRDIAAKNSLASIFNDSEEYDKVRKSVYNDRGLPNFRYKNEDFREQFQEKDILYYYHLKSEVRVFLEEEDKEILGKVKFVNIVAEIIEIELENEDIHVTALKNITRIL